MAAPPPPPDPPAACRTCATEHCIFLEHSEKKFRGLCCGACREGFHGRSCERRLGKAPADRAFRACATPACRLSVHSWPELGGYCCRACFQGEKEHGHRCEGVPAPEGALKAHLNDRPMAGAGLRVLESERALEVLQAGRVSPSDVSGDSLPVAGGAAGQLEQPESDAGPAAAERKEPSVGAEVKGSRGPVADPALEARRTCGSPPDVLPSVAGSVTEQLEEPEDVAVRIAAKGSLRLGGSPLPATTSASLPAAGAAWLGDLASNPDSAMSRRQSPSVGAVAQPAESTSLPASGGVAAPPQEPETATGSAAAGEEQQAGGTQPPASSRASLLGTGGAAGQFPELEPAVGSAAAELGDLVDEEPQKKEGVLLPHTSLGPSSAADRSVGHRRDEPAAPSSEGAGARAWLLVPESEAAGSAPEPPAPASEPGRVWRVRGRMLARAGAAKASEELGRVEPGALVAELAQAEGSLRFTLLAGSGPSDGWLRLPSPEEANPRVVVATKDGPRAGHAEAEPGRARRVWFMAQGSRGDVQPVVAASLHLRSAGFQVRIFAPGCLRALVESRGLLFTEQGSDIQDFYARFISSSAFREGSPSNNTEAFDRWNQRDNPYGEAYGRSFSRTLIAALKEEVPDVILATLLCMPYPLLAWKRNKVPVCLIEFCPIYHLQMHAEWFARWQYAAQVAVAEVRMNPMGGATMEAINRWLTDHRVFLCHESASDFAFDRANPRDPSLRRSALRGLCKGHQVLDQTQQMMNLDSFGGGETLARVQAYLDAGAKPIYLGWGSMPVHIGFLLKFIAAFKASSVRAIICAGWARHTLAAIRDYSERRLRGKHAELVRYAEHELLFVGEVPHEWLLRRCACTVHHGGAGTTLAALRAGVPMIVTPFIADQHFWASWVQHIGAGLALDLKTDGDLVEDPRWIGAVRKVTKSKNMAAKAREWGKRLCHDSCGRAFVEFVRQALTLSTSAGAGRLDPNGEPRFGW